MWGPKKFEAFNNAHKAQQQILRAAGETGGAAKALQKAYRLMTADAGSLEPDDRESYLGLPFHRDIARAVAADEWPDPPR